jgi:hypothetical protein
VRDEKNKEMRMKYYMSLWFGLLMVSSAMAQNQKMMSALYVYHSTNEPQSYAAAGEMMDATGTTVTNEGVIYTNVPGWRGVASFLAGAAE